MKPPKFAYHAPETVEEAVEHLQHYEGDARPLSGGQSLIPMLNFRLTAPSALIDLSRIADLAYVRAEADTIHIGGMTRQRTAETAVQVIEHLPLLHEALGWTGHLPTRSRGTVGGSLAHADPSAEQPMALLALGGRVVVAGPGGRIREIEADDLFVSLFTTSLEPDELLTGIRIPAMAPDAGYAVEEFARRKGDFAIVAIAVVLRCEGERCLAARVVAGGVDSGPVRLRATERALLEGGLSVEAIESAAAGAPSEVEPSSDLNASSDYRKHLVSVLVRRAVTRAAAVARVRQQQQGVSSS
ncbi:Molybdopterin dehydrogenase [Burkholderiales bacterium 8X]|nr:Molybdopterin dehydrogenase [Burkholderiales bacterium 8X]